MTAVSQSVGWQIHKRILRKPRIYGFDGFSMICYPDSHSASSAVYFNGMPDYHEMSFMKNYLRRGDNFIDVGANIGIYSLLARSLVGPEGNLESFEPFPQTAERLRENCRLNQFSNITVHEKAASDKDGPISLITTGSDCTNYVKRNNKSEAHKHEVSVRSARIDRTVQNRTYAMIKMDIEGYEPFAINGCSELVAQEKVIVFQVELDGYSDKYGVSSDQILNQFLEFGFEINIYDGCSRKLVQTDRPWDYGRKNVLAISKNQKSFVQDRIS